VEKLEHRCWLQLDLEEAVVARIYGLHEIELRPGVDPVDFERYFTEEFASGPPLRGWSTALLKGDSGQRAGKYLVMFEIDSVEARDEYFSGVSEPTEAFNDYLENNPRMAAAMQKQDDYVASELTTDYVVIGD
jgi:hypothetical protein